MRELLSRGADVQARSSIGRTALHLASFCGRVEAVRELFQRAVLPDVNAQAVDGDTPLIEACMGGHLMTATLLIGFGADLALRSNDGSSALRAAKWRKAQDALPPAAGAAPVSAEARAEHAAVVALLKVHGAP